MASANTYKTASVIISVLSVVLLMLFYIKHSYNREHLVVKLNTSRLSFLYEDDAVYETAVQISKQTCMKINRNTTVCEQLMNCSSAYTDASGGDSCMSRFPKAILIGAYKSGTREVLDFLTMNPYIKIKRYPGYEVTFFDQQFHEGLEWYRNQMPPSTGEQITMEKSPSYMTSLLAPKRMYEMDAGVKIVAVLREPVSRAHAHFTFDREAATLKYGDSFQSCAFTQSWNGSKTFMNYSKVVTNCFAIKHSLYVRWIENYLKFFKLYSFHIIDWTELVRNPCHTIRELEMFLFNGSLINCTNFIYNTRKGFYCVRDVTGKHAGVCYGDNRGRISNGINLTANVYKSLSKFFKPYNKRLFAILNKTYDWYASFFIMLGFYI